VNVKIWVVLGVIIIGIIIMVIITPTFIDTRIGAHETCAIGGLRTLVTMESTWQQQDYDGNGRPDYWTYDVSCLYRIHPTETKITNGAAVWNAFCFVRADAAPAPDNVFGLGTIEIWAGKVATPTPMGGYLYKALKKDENGKPYNQNLFKDIHATNDSKYGFIAVPDIYGTSGILTFIVNQEGIIYATDPGSDEKKWIDQWLAKDPTTVLGPGNKKWQIVQ
jgi:hypothetical protein